MQGFSTKSVACLCVIFCLCWSISVAAQTPATAPSTNPVNIDPDSAKAALRDFVAFARSGETDKAKAFFAADNDDESQMARLYSNFVLAQGKLEKAVIAKFGATAQRFNRIPTERGIAIGTEGVAGHFDVLKSRGSGLWSFPMVKTADGWKISTAALLKKADAGMPREATKQMLAAADKAADRVIAQLEA